MERETGNREQGTGEESAALAVEKMEGLAPLMRGQRIRAEEVQLARVMDLPKPEPIRRNAIGFTPLMGQVLVRMCTAEEMSETGMLYIPETAQEKPIEGIVVAASAGRFDLLGRWVPSEVETGDRVLYGKYSGAAIVLRGEEMRLMSEAELLGIIR
jgi:chaperonin GroES